MNNNAKCPKCGEYKKPWFKLCWNCTEKEKQIPKCDVCGIEVPEGHNLCKKHYAESKAKEKTPVTKQNNETDFRTKYEGRYEYNRIKFKSKSGVIIYLFLKQNNLDVYYEEELNFQHSKYHPDFVIEDGKGNTIILEHFGGEEPSYLAIMKEKIKKYTELCKKEKNVFFIYTTEDDIYNLKDRLGKKLNETPLNCFRWK